jgi:hypothetical protein
MYEMDGDKTKAMKDVNITLLDSMLWIKTAWKEVTPKVIKNCFKKAGFPVDEEDEAVEIPVRRFRRI